MQVRHRPGHLLRPNGRQPMGADRALEKHERLRMVNVECIAGIQQADTLAIIYHSLRIVLLVYPKCVARLAQFHKLWDRPSYVVSTLPRFVAFRIVWHPPPPPESILCPRNHHENGHWAKVFFCIPPTLSHGYLFPIMAPEQANSLPM
jgi:hypothetical protein